jgi:hypothetical protein
MHPPQFRISVRVLTVFLVVGVLMLAAASYFVVGIGQARLRDAWGDNLRQVADQTAATVDRYVFNRIIDASVLAAVPDIRGAAAAGSKKPFDRKAALDIDRQWQEAVVPAATRDVLTNKASAFLTDVSRLNPIFRDLVLTDAFGRVVATARAAGRYLQSEEAWWQKASGDGVHGQLVVSDVRLDPRTNSWNIEIAAPVSDAPGGSLVGVLRTVVDMRDLGALLGGVRLGTTGDAMLLREDGTFVYALEATDPNARYFAADLMRERIAAVKKGEPQTPLYFGATTANGTPRLVGIAATQLKATFPQLKWVVAVSQSESELFAPVRAQATSLVVVLGLTAIAVLAFALWYSVRLAAPPEADEMDMHLVQHPRVHQIEEPEETEEQEKEAVT